MIVKQFLFTGVVMALPNIWVRLYLYRRSYISVMEIIIIAAPFDHTESIIGDNNMKYLGLIEWGFGGDLPHVML